MSNNVKSEQYNIQEALEKVDNGEWRLPTFQRAFVWKDSDIILLLDSIFHNYPTGVLLIMPDEGFLAKQLFKNSNGTNESEALVLDGQQRLTSCYNAFYNKGRIYNDGTRKYFFIDMDALYRKCLEVGMSGKKYDISNISLVDNNSDKIIVTRKLKKEPDNIIEGNLIPFYLLKDDVTFNNFFREYLKSANKTEEQKEFLDVQFRSLLQPFTQYSFQTLTLSKGMDVSAICRIFETLNNTGIKLDSFDICVAKYLAEDADVDIKMMLDYAIQANPSLRPMFVKDENKDEYRNREVILQTIALRNGVDHKKNALAKSLSASDIKSNWDEAIQALVKTAEILNGVARTKSTMGLLPYSVVLPVISAALMKSGYSRMSQIDQTEADQKVVKYFFYTAFNERYADGAPGKMGKDFTALCEWIMSDTEPDPSTGFECCIHWDYNRFKQFKKSDKGAIAMALRCILYRKNPTDFYRDDVVELNVSNLHHLFPEHRYKPYYEDVDSVFNLTYLINSTNEAISDDPVKVYTDRIIESLGGENKFKDKLEDHFITGDTYNLYRDEAYSEFIKSRSEEIRKEMKEFWNLNIDCFEQDGSTMEESNDVLEG